ncbi:MAG: hypothetical protein EOO24_12875 [Comamonadaceae bacterium]|nr:MAG: hypothetical protein EOO24_12875 [Comamonadaceae bacterium]
MHAAPSVGYPVGRSRVALGLLALAWLAGLAAATAWTVQAQAPGWRQALAFGVVAAGGVQALAAWLRSPVGVLAWTGDAWRWEPSARGAAPESGRPVIALDLQSRLLLRWRADGGPVRWLSVERGAAPAHWDALRRAVYSRANTDAPHGAAPPVAGR